MFGSPIIEGQAQQHTGQLIAIVGGKHPPTCLGVLQRKMPAHVFRRPDRAGHQTRVGFPPDQADKFSQMFRVPAILVDFDHRMDAHPFNAASSEPFPRATVVNVAMRKPSGSRGNGTLPQGRTVRSDS